ncbi:MAG TPA: hypothetical protein VGA80_02360, partial [Flavobacteriaceae bacterium]
NRDPNVICFIKVINAPRPTMKIVQGDIIDGSRHDNGMLKRTPDKKVESSLMDMFANAIYDAETGDILFFSSIGFKDTKIDVKDLKKMKKALK